MKTWTTCKFIEELRKKLSVANKNFIIQWFHYFFLVPRHFIVGNIVLWTRNFSIIYSAFQNCSSYIFIHEQCIRKFNFTGSMACTRCWLSLWYLSFDRVMQFSFWVRHSDIFYSEKIYSVTFFPHTYVTWVKMIYRLYYLFLRSVWTLSIYVLVNFLMKTKT